MGTRVTLSVERIKRFKCSAGKSQAFLWDKDVKGLALRATKTGAKAYVVQSRVGGKSFRMTIGTPLQFGGPWTIEEAQVEARRLIRLIDQGSDPRAEKRATQAEDKDKEAAEKVARARLEVTGLQAWEKYLQARKPHWRQRTYLDHVRHSKAGGVKRLRASGKTIPSVLHALLVLPLAQIDGDTVKAWARRETEQRPTVTRYGYRMMRAFINWCLEHPEYKQIVVADAFKSKALREILGRGNAKGDSLVVEQLPAWFAEVRRDANTVVAAYLQTLLMTGARREELMGLRWSDVDFKWETLHIADKVKEGGRTIPLTPYVASLLYALPRRNQWVFSSPSAKSGRLQDVRRHLVRVMEAADIQPSAEHGPLTLHGLRRSFSNLAEWVEVPVGVVAQLMGHTASAISEKHYKQRPIDLLRMWHRKIEAFILEKGEVDFEATPAGLRAVA